MTELFQQLKEKHLVRTAIVYIGGAWLLLEATGFFVDNYALSRHILDVVVLLIVLGFPAALIISWFHGEKGRQDLARIEAALLLTLAVFAAVGTYRISTASELGSTSGERVGAASTETRAADDLGERSIAVLPFTNGTGLDSLDWVGAGVSDMLTTSLARGGELRVVSPQRLFELLRGVGREETDVIPDDVAMHVAGEAGARRMVRGSVLGTLDDLVLDVQLIDLADGTVVAGDRVRGSDVFAMSDSLAEWVAATLDSDGEPGIAAFAPSRPPPALTGDPERLKEYSLAIRSAWSQEGVEASYRVVDLLDDWSGRESEVRRALERIIRTDPDDSRALAGLVGVAASQGDRPALDSLIPRYLRAADDSLRARMNIGRAYERLGDVESAREIYRDLVAEDPLLFAALDRLVRTYLEQDRASDAREELDRLVRRHPALTARARLLIADTHVWEGDFAAALADYAEAEAGGSVQVRAAALEGALSVRWLLDPEDGVSRLNRSVWRLLDLGRHQEALNVVEGAEHVYVRSSDRLPPVDTHVLLYVRARALELAGSDRAAAAAYARLLRTWGHVIERMPLLADAPDRLDALRSR